MIEESVTVEALSWSDLEALAPAAAERVEGPTNAQANLRLFGHSEADVQVMLFRDHHAWCPYCQKVWLWLGCAGCPTASARSPCAVTARRSPGYGAGSLRDAAGWSSTAA